jgi:hypothetical protein
MNTADTVVDGGAWWLSFLPLFFIFTGLAILYLAVHWMRWRVSRRGKRPPFTKNMLRSPGESLQRQVDEINLDLFGQLLMVMFLPAIVGGMTVVPFREASWGTVALLTVVAIGSALFLAVKAKRSFDRRNLLMLAAEGERAVGEELNQLMLQGYRVYHDFPADHFNIDHVVIGSRGVFAMETKTRSKAPRGSGPGAAKVTFDGNSLRFPGHQEAAAIEQAERQASWLAKWLAQAVGEPFSVTPVVILPGWYVELTAAPRSVFVLGSGSIQKHFPTLGRTRLSVQQVQRIAYQVEQRCRTVEPWTPARMKKAA